MAKRTPNDLAIAVGYLRVSTGKQELGLDAQRTAIESFAAQKGVTVRAWFTDQGVSGSTDLEERPGLMGALSALREHKAGALLVAKRDRLARDVMVAVTIERAAGAAGAQLVSVDGTGNGDTPADEFMRTIINGAAQYERALIRARTKAALAEKRARGEKLGGHVPFGYRVGEDGKTLVEDAEEQFIIKTVRAAKARGDSLRAIVGALERRGLLSRRATPLGLTQVARMAA